MFAPSIPAHTLYVVSFSCFFFPHSPLYFKNPLYISIKNFSLTLWLSVSVCLVQSFEIMSSLLNTFFFLRSMSRFDSLSSLFLASLTSGNDLRDLNSPGYPSTTRANFIYLVHIPERRLSPLCVMHFFSLIVAPNLSLSDDVFLRSSIIFAAQNLLFHVENVEIPDIIKKLSLFGGTRAKKIY